MLPRSILRQCTSFVRRALLSTTPAAEHIRLIDETGQNRGLVARAKVVIPPGHVLRQVSKDVFRIYPADERPTADPEPAVDKVDTKELRVRTAIGPEDLARAVDKIADWLRDSRRRKQVRLVVQRDKGIRLRALNRTPEQLLATIQHDVAQALLPSEAEGQAREDGASSVKVVFSAVERNALSLVCVMTPKHRRDKAA